MINVKIMTKLSHTFLINQTLQLRMHVYHNGTNYSHLYSWRTIQEWGGDGVKFMTVGEN